MIIALALSVLGSAGAAWLLGRLRPRAATGGRDPLGRAITIEGYGGPIDDGPVPARPACARHAERLAPSAAGRGRARAADRRPGSRTVHARVPVQHAAAPPPDRQRLHGLRVRAAGLPGRARLAAAGGREPARRVSRPAVDRREVRAGPPRQGTWSGRNADGPTPSSSWTSSRTAPGIAGPGRHFNEVVAWTLSPRRRGPRWTKARSYGCRPRRSRPRRRRCRNGSDTRSTGASRRNGSQGGRKPAASGSASPSRGRRTWPGWSSSLRPAGVGDYPRGLEIESESGDGSRITLYSGPFVPFLCAAWRGPWPGSPAVIDLPSNGSRAVWIRQTGQSRTWQWTIHELQVYERRLTR